MTILHAFLRSTSLRQVTSPISLYLARQSTCFTNFSHKKKPFTRPLSTPPQPNPQRKPPPPPPPPQNNNLDFYMKLAGLLVFLLLSNALSQLLAYYRNQRLPNEITWDQFINECLKDDNYIRLSVNSQTKTVLVYLNAPAYAQAGVAPNSSYVKLIRIGNLDLFYEKLFKLLKKSDSNSRYHIDVACDDERHFDVLPFYARFLNTLNNIALISMVIFIVFGFVFRSRMKMPANIFSLFNEGGGEKIKQFEVKTNVTFADVVGCDSAKREIAEFAQFLTSPERFERLGAKLPRGGLLYGPPGTGKTLIAKALAKECNVPIFVATGSDFVQTFAGMGAHKVRQLFNEAKSVQPSIIFIDEFDSVAGERSGKSLAGVRENDSTVNQILVEMDGFASDNKVVVLAATNRLNFIDKALLRPGRFDRHVHVALPDKKGREDLFDLYLNKLKLSENLIRGELKKVLADLTPGFSGADIANICNEAAVFAARNDSNTVQFEHFDAAIDRVVAGSSNVKKITESERKVIAIHEAGHFVANAFGKTPLRVPKVSIMPRGKALGYNFFVPPDKLIVTGQELLSQIVTLLGGRVAEELYTETVTTGAINDLQRVVKMAYGYTAVYGLDEKSPAKHLSFPSVMTDNAPDIGSLHMFDTVFADEIDGRVREIVESCKRETEQLLVQHKEVLLRLSEKLLEKEVLNEAELASFYK